MIEHEPKAGRTADLPWAEEIEKEIASIDSEKLAPNDKKGQLNELQSELKSPAEPVQFPANIDLVVKNYDKLNAAMPPVQ